MADKVAIQLIEADVEIGFALVDEAKAYGASGQAEFRSRAVRDAEEVVTDIERRLQQLEDAEAAPFHPLVSELTREIAEARQEDV